MNCFVFLLFLNTAYADIDSKKDPKLVERVYTSYCSSCHTKDKQILYFDPKQEASEMIKSIRSGSSAMPMYAWLFTDEDLKKLIEYMRITSKK